MELGKLLEPGAFVFWLPPAVFAVPLVDGLSFADAAEGFCRSRVGSEATEKLYSFLKHILMNWFKFAKSFFDNMIP